MKRIPLHFRGFAWVLIFSFCLEPVAQAAPDFPAARAIRISFSPSYNIPPSVARVRDSFAAPSSKKLFLIEDAHANPSGQLNLAKALEIILREEEQLKYVFVEAGRGDNSLTPLRVYGDADFRKLKAMRYVKSGELHGEEFLNLVSEKPFTIWGVEDLALYSRSVENYRFVKQNREKLQAYLASIGTTIESLKMRLVGPELASLLGARVSYRRQKMDFSAYIATLFNTALFANIPLTAYPSLQKLSAIRKEEARIDFESASREQAAAIGRLPKEEQEALREYGKRALASRFRPDDPAQDGFFAALEEKIEKSADFPELSRYFAYRKKVRAIDPECLLDEAQLLEDEIIARLSRTENERQIVRAADALDFWKKIFDLTLTPEELDRGRAWLGPAIVRETTGFLNRKIMDLETLYERALFLEPGFEEALASAKGFYELTAERDERFISATLRKMTEAGQTHAALITGGFHTPNLKKLLREKGVSYVCLTPQVFAETNRRRYEEILLNQPVVSGKDAKSPSKVSTNRTMAAAWANQWDPSGVWFRLESDLKTGARLSVSPEPDGTADKPKNFPGRIWAHMERGHRLFYLNQTLNAFGNFLAYASQKHLSSAMGAMGFSWGGTAAYLMIRRWVSGIQEPFFVRVSRGQAALYASVVAAQVSSQFLTFMAFDYINPVSWSLILLLSPVFQHVLGSKLLGQKILWDHPTSIGYALLAASAVLRIIGDLISTGFEATGTGLVLAAGSALSFAWYWTGQGLFNQGKPREEWMDSEKLLTVTSTLNAVSAWGLYATLAVGNAGVVDRILEYPGTAGLVAVLMPLWSALTAPVRVRNIERANQNALWISGAAQFSSQPLHIAVNLAGWVFLGFTGLNPANWPFTPMRGGLEWAVLGLAFAAVPFILFSAHERERILTTGREWVSRVRLAESRQDEKAVKPSFLGTIYKLYFKPWTLAETSLELEGKFWTHYVFMHINYFIGIALTFGTLGHSLSSMQVHETFSSGPMIGGVVVGTAVVIGSLGMISLLWKPSETMASIGAGLKTGGIYRFVRHPVYLAGGIALLGQYLSGFGPAIPYGLLSYVYLVVDVAATENLFLWEKFGKRFVNYAEKTPSFFPRIGPPSAARLANISRRQLLRKGATAVVGPLLLSSRAKAQDNTGRSRVSFEGDQILIDFSEGGIPEDLKQISIHVDGRPITQKFTINLESGLIREMTSIGTQIPHRPYSRESSHYYPILAILTRIVDEELHKSRRLSDEEFLRVLRLNGPRVTLTSNKQQVVIDWHPLIEEIPNSAITKLPVDKVTVSLKTGIIEVARRDMDRDGQPFMKRSDLGSPALFQNDDYKKSPLYPAIVSQYAKTLEQIIKAVEMAGVTETSAEQSEDLRSVLTRLHEILANVKGARLAERAAHEKNTASRRHFLQSAALALSGLFSAKLSLEAQEEPSSLTTGESASGIRLTVFTAGNFLIETRPPSPAWTFEGRVVGFEATEGTSGNNFLSNLKEQTGKDSLGPYREITFNHTADGREGGIRIYEDKPSVVFTTKTMEEVSNDAPLVEIRNTVEGFYELGYEMATDGLPRPGVSWTSKFGPPGTNAEGAWAFFDDHKNTFIVSPMVEAKVTRFEQSEDSLFRVNVDRAIPSLEAGYVHQTILQVGQGIGQTFENWGKAILDFHGQTRRDRDSDSPYQFLTVNTNAGSTLYYDPDFEKHLLALIAEMDAKGVPPGAVLLDSHTYLKGDEADHSWRNRTRGIFKMQPDPENMPNGRKVYSNLGLYLIQHFRWFSSGSPLRGDPENEFSNNMPTGEKYWTAQAKEFKEDGVSGALFDWADNLATPHLRAWGKYWNAVAKAMKETGIVGHMAMSRPSDPINGAQYGFFGWFRASLDGFRRVEPKDRLIDRRPEILINGLLAGSFAGIDPDHVMSRDGNLLGMVVRLGGMVSIGDGPGEVDAANLKKIGIIGRTRVKVAGVEKSRPALLIVKPDTWARLTDETILELARGNKTAPIIYQNDTDFGSGLRAVYLGAFERTDGASSPISVTPRSLGFSEGAFFYNQDTKKNQFIADPDQSFTDSVDYLGSNYVAVPVASGLAFLGDKNLYVPLGRQRVTDLREGPDGSLIATVRFGEGENKIVLHGYSSNVPDVQMAQGSFQLKYEEDGYFEIEVGRPAAGDTVIVSMKSVGARLAKQNEKKEKGGRQKAETMTRRNWMPKAAGIASLLGLSLKAQDNLSGFTSSQLFGRLLLDDLAQREAAVVEALRRSSERNFRKELTRYLIQQIILSRSRQDVPRTDRISSIFTRLDQLFPDTEIDFNLFDTDLSDTIRAEALRRMNDRLEQDPPDPNKFTPEIQSIVFGGYRVDEIASEADRYFGLARIQPPPPDAIQIFDGPSFSDGHLLRLRRQKRAARILGDRSAVERIGNRMDGWNSPILYSQGYSSWITEEIIDDMENGATDVDAWFSASVFGRALMEPRFRTRAIGLLERKTYPDLRESSVVILDAVKAKLVARALGQSEGELDEFLDRFTGRPNGLFSVFLALTSEYDLDMEVEKELILLAARRPAPEFRNLAFTTVPGDQDSIFEVLQTRRIPQTTFRGVLRGLLNQETRAASQKILDSLLLSDPAMQKERSDALSEYPKREADRKAFLDRLMQRVLQGDSDVPDLMTPEIQKNLGLWDLNEEIDRRFLEERDPRIKFILLARIGGLSRGNDQLWLLKAMTSFLAPVSYPKELGMALSQPIEYSGNAYWVADILFNYWLSDAPSLNERILDFRSTTNTIRQELEGNLPDSFPSQLFRSIFQETRPLADRQRLAQLFLKSGNIEEAALSEPDTLILMLRNLGSGDFASESLAIFTTLTQGPLKSFVHQMLVQENPGFVDRLSTPALWRMLAEMEGYSPLVQSVIDRLAQRNNLNLIQEDIPTDSKAMQVIAQAIRQQNSLQSKSLILKLIQSRPNQVSSWKEWAGFERSLLRQDQRPALWDTLTEIMNAGARLAENNYVGGIKNGILEKFQKLFNRNFSRFQNAFKSPAVSFRMIRDDQNRIRSGMSEFYVATFLTFLDVARVFQGSYDFAAGEKWGSQLRARELRPYAFWKILFPWGAAPGTERWLLGYFLTLQLLFFPVNGTPAELGRTRRYSHFLHNPKQFLASLESSLNQKYTLNWMAYQAAARLAGSHQLDLQGLAALTRQALKVAQGRNDFTFTIREIGDWMHFIRMPFSYKQLNSKLFQLSQAQILKDVSRQFKDQKTHYALADRVAERIDDDDFKEKLLAVFSMSIRTMPELLKQMKRLPGWRSGARLADKLGVVATVPEEIVRQLAEKNRKFLDHEGLSNLFFQWGISHNWKGAEKLMGVFNASGRLLQRHKIWVDGKSMAGSVILTREPPTKIDIVLEGRVAPQNSPTLFLGKAELDPNNFLVSPKGMAQFAYLLKGHVGKLTREDAVRELKNTLTDLEEWVRVSTLLKMMVSHQLPPALQSESQRLEYVTGSPDEVAFAAIDAVGYLSRSVPRSLVGQWAGLVDDVLNHPAKGAYYQGRKISSLSKIVASGFHNGMDVFGRIRSYLMDLANGHEGKVLIGAIERKKAVEALAHFPDYDSKINDYLATLSEGQDSRMVQTAATRVLKNRRSRIEPRISSEEALAMILNNSGLTYRLLSESYQAAERTGYLSVANSAPFLSLSEGSFLGTEMYFVDIRLRRIKTGTLTMYEIIMKRKAYVKSRGQNVSIAVIPNGIIDVDLAFGPDRLTRKSAERFASELVDLVKGSRLAANPESDISELVKIANMVSDAQERQFEEIIGDQLFDEYVSGTNRLITDEQVTARARQALNLMQPDGIGYQSVESPFIESLQHQYTVPADRNSADTVIVSLAGLVADPVMGLYKNATAFQVAQLILAIRADYSAARLAVHSNVPFPMQDEILKSDFDETLEKFTRFMKTPDLAVLAGVLSSLEKQAIRSNEVPVSNNAVNKLVRLATMGKLEGPSGERLEIVRSARRPRESSAIASAIGRILNLPDFAKRVELGKNPTPESYLLVLLNMIAFESESDSLRSREDRRLLIEYVQHARLVVDPAFRLRATHSHGSWGRQNLSGENVRSRHRWSGPKTSAARLAIKPHNDFWRHQAKSFYSNNVAAVNWSLIGMSLINYFLGGETYRVRVDTILTGIFFANTTAYLIINRHEWPQRAYRSIKDQAVSLKRIAWGTFWAWFGLDVATKMIAMILLTQHAVAWNSRPTPQIIYSLISDGFPLLGNFMGFVNLLHKSNPDTHQLAALISWGIWIFMYPAQFKRSSKTRALMAAGALSNIGQGVLMGGGTDWLAVTIPGFPGVFDAVWNIADVSVILGVILFIYDLIDWIFERKPKTISPTAARLANGGDAAVENGERRKVKEILAGGQMPALASSLEILGNERRTASSSDWTLISNLPRRDFMSVMSSLMELISSAIKRISWRNDSTSDPTSDGVKSFFGSTIRTFLSNFGYAVNLIFSLPDPLSSSGSRLAKVRTSLPNGQEERRRALDIAIDTYRWLVISSRQTVGSDHDRENIRRFTAYKELVGAITQYLGSNKLVYIYPIAGPDVTFQLYAPTYILNKDSIDPILGRALLEASGVLPKLDYKNVDLDFVYKNVVNPNQSLDAYRLASYTRLKRNKNEHVVLVMKGLMNIYKNLLDYDGEPSSAINRKLKAFLNAIGNHFLRVGDQVIAFQKEDREAFEEIFGRTGSYRIVYQNTRILDEASYSITSGFPTRVILIPSEITIYKKTKTGQGEVLSAARLAGPDISSSDPTDKNLKKSLQRLMGTLGATYSSDERVIMILNAYEGRSGISMESGFREDTLEWLDRVIRSYNVESKDTSVWDRASGVRPTPLSIPSVYSFLCSDFINDESILIERIHSIGKLPERFRYEIVAFHLLQQGLHDPLASGRTNYQTEIDKPDLTIAEFLAGQAFEGLRKNLSEDLKRKLRLGIARTLFSYLQDSEALRELVRENNPKEVLEWVGGRNLFSKALFFMGWGDFRDASLLSRTRILLGSDLMDRIARLSASPDEVLFNPSLYPEEFKKVESFKGPVPLWLRVRRIWKTSELVRQEIQKIRSAARLATRRNELVQTPRLVVKPAAMSGGLADGSQNSMSQVRFPAQADTLYKNYTVFDEEKRAVVADAKSMRHGRQVGDGFGADEGVIQRGVVLQFFLDTVLNVRRKGGKVLEGLWTKLNGMHNEFYASRSLFFTSSKETQPFSLASAMEAFRRATSFGLTGNRLSISSISAPAGLARLSLYSVSGRRSTSSSSIFDNISKRANTSNTKTRGTLFLSTNTAAFEPFSSLRMLVGMNFFHQSILVAFTLAGKFFMSQVWHGPIGVSSVAARLAENVTAGSRLAESGGLKRPFMAGLAIQTFLLGVLAGFWTPFAASILLLALKPIWNFIKKEIRRVALEIVLSSPAPSSGNRGNAVLSILQNAEERGDAFPMIMRDSDGQRYVSVQGATKLVALGIMVLAIVFPLWRLIQDEWVQERARATAEGGFMSAPPSEKFVYLEPLPHSPQAVIAPRLVRSAKSKAVSPQNAEDATLPWQDGDHVHSLLGKYQVSFDHVNGDRLDHSKTQDGHSGLSGDMRFFGVSGDSPLNISKFSAVELPIRLEGPGILYVAITYYPEERSYAEQNKGRVPYVLDPHSFKIGQEGFYNVQIPLKEDRYLSGIDFLVSPVSGTVYSLYRQQWMVDRQKRQMVWPGPEPTKTDANVATQYSYIEKNGELIPGRGTTQKVRTPGAVVGPLRFISKGKGARLSTRSNHRQILKGLAATPLNPIQLFGQRLAINAALLAVSGQKFEKFGRPYDMDTAEGIERQKVKVAGHDVRRRSGESAIKDRIIFGVPAGMNAVSQVHNNSVALQQPQELRDLGLGHQNPQGRTAQDFQKFGHRLAGENGREKPVEKSVVDFAGSASVQESGYEDVRVNDYEHARNAPGGWIRTGAGSLERRSSVERIADAILQPTAPNGLGESHGPASRPGAVSLPASTGPKADSQALPLVLVGTSASLFASGSPTSNGTLTDLNRQAAARLANNTAQGTRRKAHETTATSDKRQATGGARLSLKEELKKYGIEINDDGSLNFSKIPEKTSWVMDQIRPETHQPFSIRLNTIPKVKTLFPITTLSRLGFGHTAVLLGIVEEADGSKHPAAIKILPSWQVWVKNPHREVLWEQVHDRLGSAPKFYGIVLNQEGEPVAYATQLIIGQEVPKDSIHWSDPDMIEMRRRASKHSLRNVSDFMISRTGHYVGMDMGALTDDMGSSNMRSIHRFLRYLRSREGARLADSTAQGTRHTTHDKAETRTTHNSANPIRGKLPQFFERISQIFSTRLAYAGGVEMAVMLGRPEQEPTTFRVQKNGARLTAVDEAGVEPSITVALGQARSAKIAASLAAGNSGGSLLAMTSKVAASSDRRIETTKTARAVSDRIRGLRGLAADVWKVSVPKDIMIDTKRLFGGLDDDAFKEQISLFSDLWTLLHRNSSQDTRVVFYGGDQLSGTQQAILMPFIEQSNGFLLDGRVSKPQPGRVLAWVGFGPDTRNPTNGSIRLDAEPVSESQAPDWTALYVAIQITAFDLHSQKLIDGESGQVDWTDRPAVVRALRDERFDTLFQDYDAALYAEHVSGAHYSDKFLFALTDLILRREVQLQLLRRLIQQSA